MKPKSGPNRTTAYDHSGAANANQFMTSSERHQKIRAAVMRRPEAMLEVTLDLWEKLAGELVPIVGERGFQSLYAKSTCLANAAYPWLAQGKATDTPANRFAGLKSGLAGRGARESGEASITLFVTFVDALALLIGEQLMDTILRAAWGDDACEPIEKEQKK